VPSDTDKRQTPTLRQEPEHVRFARDNAGLRQAEAARELGISPQLLADIEAGRRSATPPTLSAMARVYNIPRRMLERARWSQ